LNLTAMYITGNVVNICSIAYLCGYNEKYHVTKLTVKSLRGESEK